MLQVDKMKTSELKGLFSVESYCSAVFFLVFQKLCGATLVLRVRLSPFSSRTVIGVSIKCFWPSHEISSYAHSTEGCR